jgi:hypothetical protein
MDGSIEGIYARCIEEGDCWLWQGPVDTNGIPIMRITGSRKLHLVRRHILQMDGTVLGSLRATNTCNVTRCVNPEHAIGWPMSKLIKRAAKTTGYASNPARNAKIALKKRELSPITPEQIDEIRSSTESGHAIARRLGFCQATVQAIRAHETWKTYSSPFAGLGSR